MASKELFSLGALYPSDFLKPGTHPNYDPVELKLVMDDDGMVHLDKMAPNEAMWGGEKYWYASGVNLSMKAALKDVVDTVLPLSKGGSNFLDIACNDGTLLSYVPKNWRRAGIDPCKGDILKAATEHGIIVNDYFSAEALYRARLFPPKFDVITSIAMFYDIADPDSFVRDIDEVLEDEGIWVMQLSYTPLMVRQLAFDNICHEHFAYHSLASINNILERNGFRIVDCTFNNVNGGSMRVFVRKAKADSSKFGCQSHRDVCKMRVRQALLDEETNPTNWKLFYQNIQSLKSQVTDFIKQEKLKGKSIMGYGASTKGNTLLQWFGLDNTMIDAIAEKQEAKWSLRTVGTNIPIISEEEMRKAHPDYLLILPWHFVSEFCERERDYLNEGGRFIVPCPKFQII